NPNVHFVLAGLILEECKERIAQLQSFNNVTCPGLISVEQGRFLLSQCSVGLIPFTPGSMNNAINPVKMYAYALLGKPVLGTAIRELCCRPDIALVGDSGTVLSSRLSEALDMTSRKEVTERLRMFAMENTWTQRAEAAWEVIRHLVEPELASEVIS